MSNKKTKATRKHSAKANKFFFCEAQQLTDANMWNKWTDLTFQQKWKGPFSQTTLK